MVAVASLVNPPSMHGITSGTSITGVARPTTSITQGSTVLVMVVHHQASSSLTTGATSTGWTAIPVIPEDTTTQTNPGWTVLWKVVGASEATTYTVTVPSGEATAWIFAVNNVDTSFPLGWVGQSNTIALGGGPSAVAAPVARTYGGQTMISAAFRSTADTDPYDTNQANSFTLMHDALFNSKHYGLFQQANPSSVTIQQSLDWNFVAGTSTSNAAGSGFTFLLNSAEVIDRTITSGASSVSYSTGTGFTQLDMEIYSAGGGGTGSTSADGGGGGGAWGRKNFTITHGQSLFYSLGGGGAAGSGATASWFNPTTNSSTGAWQANGGGSSSTQTGGAGGTIAAAPSGSWDDSNAGGAGGTGQSGGGSRGGSGGGSSGGPSGVGTTGGVGSGAAVGAGAAAAGPGNSRGGDGGAAAAAGKPGNPPGGGGGGGGSSSGAGGTGGAPALRLVWTKVAAGGGGGAKPWSYTQIVGWGG